jgi:predicted O-methyltransferase YrrM
MIELLPQLIEDYCEEHTSPESDMLYQLNRETHLCSLRPRMLSGPLQGGLLSLISRLMRPLHILEIGTFTGYAALCLAEGLQENGTLDTIEIDPEAEEMIRCYFEQSPYKDRLFLHIGAALDILPALPKIWDLVMIDANKKEYLDYYKMIIPQVRKGGIVLVDNVLWSGKVVEEVKCNDKDTQAILAFNDYVQQDPAVRNLLLPFRDGIMIIEKL